MKSDIALDNEEVVVMGQFINAHAHDFMLNSPDRMTEAPGRKSVRRALVHDIGDKLTINYGGDYPLGVKIVGSVEVVDALTVYPNYPNQRIQSTNPRSPHPIVVGTELVSLREELDALKAQVAALAAKVR